MQVEYKKEWLDTYLWVLSEHHIQDSYIEKMLLHNQGEGRLEFSKQQCDGEEYYCYKITGKKALNSVYSMMTIGERQIRGILQQLFTTLEIGKEYATRANKVYEECKDRIEWQENLNLKKYLKEIIEEISIKSLKFELDSNL